jgi:hypothetical protein
MVPDKLLYCLALLFIYMMPGEAMAQIPLKQEIQVVQLSGVVLAGDSLTALEGVAVYVPGTTRGTHTRKSGYFSLPVVMGDMVVFAALGHEKLYLTVPTNTRGSDMTIRITLKKKENRLPTVEVMPWATENDLKHAVLRTKLPEEPTERLPTIPPPVVYKSLTDMPAMDSDANFKYGLQQQEQLRDARIRVPDIFKVSSRPIKYY